MKIQFFVRLNAPFKCMKKLLLIKTFDVLESNNVGAFKRIIQIYEKFVINRLHSFLINEVECFE